MHKTFTKKKRQIEILKNKIISSGLIQREILEDAEKLYNENPYHNFLHALVVADYVLRLPSSKLTLLEVRSLLIAALFHDTGHTGYAMELDEFVSLDNFRKTMDKYPEYIINDAICRSAIIGTVFKNRGKNKNRYARILGDCDIGNIGEGIVEFMYYGSLLSLEYDVSIEDFFTITEKEYFLFLMNINKKIIITEEVREVLPNSLKTIKEFYKIPLSTKIEMFNLVRDKDITLEEFRNIYFKKT